MKTETLDEFLKRGGQITKAQEHQSERSLNSRYKQKDLDRHDRGMSAILRVDNYKKASGGKLPRDVQWYLKFSKRLGL